MNRPDFDRVAQLYVKSSVAQHGDLEDARWEAQEWWALFVLIEPSLLAWEANE